MNVAPVQGDYEWRVAIAGFLQLPRPARLAVIAEFVRAMVLADQLYIQSFPGVPLLYASGVVYREDPIGNERWKNVGDVIVAGAGDCKDLAAWRCAEIRQTGIDAKIQIDEYPDVRPGGPDFHVLVRLPDGTTEDPSRRLGMP